MTSYFERLTALTAQRGNLCVGVDPHQAIVESWGYSYDLAGIEKVSRDLVAAVGDLVGVYKPQSAFFECFGTKGIGVLARVIDDIHACGALAILDVKRGDIGSTMAAYARAYLDGNSDLCADAITVSPYLGFGALRPAIDLAHSTGRGLYVLCRTSNPEGIQLQSSVSDGRSVAQAIVDHANEVNSESGVNAVGLVIGATLEKLGLDLSGFQGSILAPGVGAQGGSVDHLHELFHNCASRVLMNVSRGVMSAGPAEESLRNRVASLKS